MLRVAVWVDRGWAPSGRLLLSRFAVIRLLLTGAPVTRKWLVAPVSAIAMSTPILILAVLNMVFTCGAHLCTSSVHNC